MILVMKGENVRTLVHLLNFTQATAAALSPNAAVKRMCLAVSCKEINIYTVQPLQRPNYDLI